MKGQEVVFSSKSDEWSTPPALFCKLDAEFGFTVDGAASPENACMRHWYGPGSPTGQFDALTTSWAGERVFLNPPYSMIKQFLAKVSYEQRQGVTSVVLIPSRTDTKYWHDYIWSEEYQTWRPGVEGRFLRGRLKFGTQGAETGNSAPFPSVVVVFRGLHI